MTLAHALRSAALIIGLCLQAGSAFGQQGPYIARDAGFGSASHSVILTDQWGTSSHTTFSREELLLPVTQNGVPPSDQHHFTYYGLLPTADPQRTILVTNKFGEDEGWTIGWSVGLLSPALLDPAPGEEVPQINHYKCYNVDSAPTYNIPISLQDQFQTFQDGAVLSPVLWCEPAEMQVGGETYPIVDQTAWLAVYRISDVGAIPLLNLPVTDQFGSYVVTLGGTAADLYVSSQKSSAVPTETKSWSAIKAEFR